MSASRKSRAQSPRLAEGLSFAIGIRVRARQLTDKAHESKSGDPEQCLIKNQAVRALVRPSTAPSRLVRSLGSCRDSAAPVVTTLSVVAAITLIPVSGSPVHDCDFQCDCSVGGGDAADLRSNGSSLASTCGPQADMASTAPGVHTVTRRN